MNSQTQSEQKTTLTTQDISRQLKIAEGAILKAALDLGFAPENLGELEAKAIANHLNGDQTIPLNGKPETEPSKAGELDSLSLVSEADDLELAADAVAQNVQNGGSIRQGFIDSEIEKTAAQAEMLAHLNTATFADTYRRTMAENMALFSDISDDNHEKFMGAIVEKFGQLGKGGDPNNLPRTMTEKAQQQQAKTSAYTQKIREDFNVKSWMN